jgi:hypothetical protein
LLANNDSAVATIGNHDFDVTLDRCARLRKRRGFIDEEAELQLVCLVPRRGCGKLLRMKIRVGDVVRGFHLALDGGLSTESLPEDLDGHFEAWVEENHPDALESAASGRLEAYLIDENEGVDVIVEYFETVPAEHLPAIYASFRDRIKEYYSNTELDPENEQHKNAIDTLAAIERASA